MGSKRNVDMSANNDVVKVVADTSATAETTTTEGEVTTVVAKKRTVNVETGGGLFAGTSGPKPPPIVYIPEALAGMRTGGRRVIIVPADVGYEDTGEGEIPPGAEFKLEVELLETRNA